MQGIMNLKIGTRFGLGFGVLIVLLVALAGVGLNMVSVVNGHIEIILHDRYVKVRKAQVVENEVNKQLRAMRTAMLAPDTQTGLAELAKIETSSNAISRVLDDLSHTVTSPQGVAALHKLLESRAIFKEQELKAVEAVRSGRMDEARSLLFSAVLPIQQNYLDAIEQFTQTQSEGMERFGTEALDAAKQAQSLLIVLACLAVLLAIGISYLLTRSITVPIAQAVRVAQTVAAGDLTSRIEVQSKDETGQLLSALNAMNSSLLQIVGQVRHSSDSIATGSNQIAAGNADLSQRTEEQASSLEQTAASMEQITATVRQSSDSAKAARDLASTASLAASKGGQVVSRAVATMRDSSASSRRIADITSVIDGIAFQTNILALNAAVEAARAGEQGKGFAVVASEVRSLAHRAASAAKEIKELIAVSVSQVDTGAGLVTDAGTTMEQIVLQVHQVAGLISEISTASEEQSDGIGQVGAAVNQLDQVTQHNAALVEESAAAAASLSAQAMRLAEVVSHFRLPGEHVAA